MLSRKIDNDASKLRRASRLLEAGNPLDALIALNGIQDPTRIVEELRRIARNGCDDAGFAKAQEYLTRGKPYDALITLNLTFNPSRIEGFEMLRRIARNSCDDTGCAQAQEDLTVRKPPDTIISLINNLFNPSRIERSTGVRQATKQSL